MLKDNLNSTILKLNYKKEDPSSKNIIEFLGLASYPYHSMIPSLFFWELSYLQKQQYPIPENIFIKDGLYFLFLEFIKNPIPPQSLDHVHFFLDSFFAPLVPPDWLPKCKFVELVYFPSPHADQNELTKIVIILGNDFFENTAIYEKQMKQIPLLLEKKSSPVSYAIIKNHETPSIHDQEAKKIIASWLHIQHLSFVDIRELIHLDPSDIAFIDLNQTSLYIHSSFFHFFLFGRGIFPLGNDKQMQKIYKINHDTSSPTFYSSRILQEISPLSPYHGMKQTPYKDRPSLWAIGHQIEIFKNRLDEIEDLSPQSKIASKEIHHLYKNFILELSKQLTCIHSEK